MSVENVWKRYRLGTVSTGMLGQDLKRWWHAKRGMPDPYEKVTEANDRRVKSQSQFVWALQDVSFDLLRGQVLGIIGRNGAGKSTLLKLLSRVTTPTRGEIKIRGRVASLLEVGTGFNPELTGRENVFLNGAILGMRKSEIERQFDEIVAFSGVERYIDTPVKRYSSGMYVRLAFAVAAHLEPEILIVDEVLAVGDAEFQRKCLGKMKDVSGQGRTILFVSHNMAAVKNLCTRAILMENGRIVSSGDVEQLANEYIQKQLGDTSASGPIANWTKENAPTSKYFRLNEVAVKNPDGQVAGTFYTDKPVAIDIRYDVFEKIAGSRVLVKMSDAQGTVVFVSTNEANEVVDKEPGSYLTSCVIPPDLLNGGNYFVTVRIGKPQVNEAAAYAENCVSFNTILMGNNGSISQTQWPGIVAPRLSWETNVLNLSGSF